MAELDPAGGRVELGRLVLRTANLAGEAELVGSRRGGTRGDAAARLSPL